MSLTRRQRQVMAEIASGDTYAEVGYRLGIAEQTVKNIAHSVNKHYGVQSTIGSLRRMGWLVVPAWEIVMEVNDGREAVEGYEGRQAAS